jgi:UDP-N-acetyl-D-glucosamine dehydrogenase
MTLSALLESIDKRTYRVGIVGLGYVGLPLIWTFHEKGFSTIGVDIDSRKIDAINEGRSYIKHIPSEVFQALAGSDKCTVTTDFAALAEADCILMCVPTPLNKYREPDMSYVIETTKSIAPYVRKGHLIVLESTTYPGTTDEIIRPICEEASGLKSGVDFYLAYSPEREDPGNPDFNTAKIPKVVGGDGDDALKLADTLYSAAVVRTVPVSSTRTAEAVKLLENIFRGVNIALVNELKLVFHKMDIDIHEVIDAAKTKPFGFMPFYPGPGLGGHCIPIDPFYLTWKAREYGENTRFIELAGEINTHMPDYVLRRTVEALNSVAKSVNKSRLLVIGVAYKPDIDDPRESPSFVVMDMLERLGAHVDFYDPWIPTIQHVHEHPRWNGEKSISWDEQVIRSYDAALILTNHKVVPYADLAEWVEVIVDTRNAMKELPQYSSKVWKA